MVAACERHGVFVNMGTLRRYDAGYDAARQLVWSGDLGKLKTIIAHSTANLFNGSSSPGRCSHLDAPYYILYGESLMK